MDRACLRIQGGRSALRRGPAGGRNGAPRWTCSSQHNLADLGTWEEVEYELVYTKMDPHRAHDRFLAALCETIKLDAERKMEAGQVDVESVRRRVGKSR